MSVKKSIQADESKGELVELPPKKLDLRNAHAIRREMASVYRDMRLGKIDPADGTKLAYVLELLRKSHETLVLEEQLTNIQSQLERGN